jgi:hypothetical protein
MNGSLKVCGWQECPNEYDRGALPLVARNRHAAMSDLSLLTGVNRTSRFRPPTSEFDP